MLVSSGYRILGGLEERAREGMEGEGKKHEERKRENREERGEVLKYGIVNFRGNYFIFVFSRSIIFLFFLFSC